MLRNLAYQLGVAFPALQPIYESATIGDGGDDVEKAFNALLLEPLKEVEQELPESVVILIDALDECDGAAATANNPVLNLLRDHLCKLPNKVRFVITTRPERHITAVLKRHFNPFDIEKDDERHTTDLKEVIAKGLQPLLASSAELQPAVELLLERSEGTFIYIAHVLDSLENSRERWTLARLHGFLPVGMAGTFKSYFDKAWRPMKPEKQQEVTDLLALLSATFEPPCIRQLAEWLRLDPAMVKGTLFSLGSLFTIKDDERVNGFHKSIYDWLRDPKTPLPYRVNATPAHSRISKALVATMVEHDSEM